MITYGVVFQAKISAGRVEAYKAEIEKVEPEKSFEVLQYLRILFRDNK